MASSDVRTFLEVMLGNFDAEISFGCYHHDRSNRRKPPHEFLRTTFMSAEDDLDFYNLDGYNIFWFPSKLDGRGTKRENVVAPRFFWIDFDDIDYPEQPPLKETVHLGRDTDTKRSQMYWRIDDEIPRDAYETCMHQLAEKFGGDHMVCRLNARARFPGYASAKPGVDADYILYDSTDVGYAFEDFCAAFELDPTKPIPKSETAIAVVEEPSGRIPQGERNAALCTLAQRLRLYNVGPRGIREALREFRDNRFDNTDPVPDSEIDSVVDWALGITRENQVDISELLSYERLVTPPSIEVTYEDNDREAFRKPAFPKEVHDMCAGTMRTIMDWLNANSFRLQPNLSFASALVTMAGLAAGAVRTHRDTPCIVVCGLARTGHGKDTGLQYPSKLLAKVPQAKKMLGSNDFASDVAFVSMVQRLSNSLFYIDEFGDKVQKTKQKQSHTAHLGSRIKEMYSKVGAGGRFVAAYADADKNKVLEDFYFSIYGAGVPDALFDGISTSDIRGGLVPRMLLIEGESEMPGHRNPPGMEIPRHLLDTIEFWAAQQLDEPIIIERTPEAEALMDKFAQETDEIMREGSEIIASFFTRCMENCAKVALIHAASRSREPVIEACDVRIAILLCRYSAQLGAWHSVNSVADTRVGHDTNLVLKTIYATGNKGITKSELSRQVRNQLDARQRQECIDTLIEGGDVIEVSENSDKPGRPTTRFVATEHLKGK